MIVDISNCPAQEGMLPNDASGCHCYYINKNKGVIVVDTKTPYNTTYYAMNKNNCCNGFAKAKDSFPTGYPTNQNGRWNWGLSNTKMHPFRGLLVKNRLPNCPMLGTECYPGDYNVIGVKQSRNIFPNTYKMSQKKLFSYLLRNRNNLNR